MGPKVRAGATVWQGRAECRSVVVSEAELGTHTTHFLVPRPFTVISPPSWGSGRERARGDCKKAHKRAHKRACAQLRRDGTCPGGRTLELMDRYDEDCCCSVLLLSLCRRW